MADSALEASFVLSIQFFIPMQTLGVMMAGALLGSVDGADAGACGARPKSSAEADGPPMPRLLGRSCAASQNEYIKCTKFLLSCVMSSGSFPARMRLVRTSRSDLFFTSSVREN